MGLGRGGGEGRWGREVGRGGVAPPVYMLKETLKYGSKFFIVCEDRGEDDQPILGPLRCKAKPVVRFGTSILVELVISYP